MSEWINPAIDRALHADLFARSGQVRVYDVLTSDRASAVGAELGQLDPWVLTCANRDWMAEISLAQMETWSDQQRADLQATLNASAWQGVGFAYLGHRLDAAWRARTAPSALSMFHDALNGPQIGDLIAEITGRRDFNGSSIQATRFGPNHYLTRHRDNPESERRRLAVVWGFTPEWHPDWGGLLQFFTDGGTPTLSFAPGFNTLDIFDVQMVHSVTYVTPFAGAVRQAISGWMVETT